MGGDVFNNGGSLSEIVRDARTFTDTNIIISSRSHSFLRQLARCVRADEINELDMLSHRDTIRSMRTMLKRQQFSHGIFYEIRGIAANVETEYTRLKSTSDNSDKLSSVKALLNELRRTQHFVRKRYAVDSLPYSLKEYYMTAFDFLASMSDKIKRQHAADLLSGRVVNEDNVSDENLVAIALSFACIERVNVLSNDSHVLDFLSAFYAGSSARKKYGLCAPPNTVRLYSNRYGWHIVNEFLSTAQ
ncbi:hypothetical protein HY486_01305 [Candidatus Woesearchaeota archaeon]|nr:hypothetical protein [Candidatus Woesearchaeota archaeon]